MEPGDREAFLAFARSVPEDDLLFLPASIAEDRVVDQWLEEMSAGRTATVLAFDGDMLVGFGSLHYAASPWTRHVGEIRLMLAPQYRGRGLGHRLGDELLSVAQAVGVTKVIAYMTLEQSDARQAFRQLGFITEALLPNHAMRADGETTDLILMANDVGALKSVLGVDLDGQP